MLEYLQNCYDARIADAAKRYRSADYALGLEGSEECRLELSKAEEHLYWLLDAKQKGWNPDDFKSEWEE